MPLLSGKRSGGGPILPQDRKEPGMTDDPLSLSKLSQLSPSGKMKNSKEIPVGKELPRKKKGKKNPPGQAPEPGAGREEGREETGPVAPSGRVVDILV
jgi:hypothetical protein